VRHEPVRASSRDVSAAGSLPAVARVLLTAIVTLSKRWHGCRHRQGEKKWKLDHVILSLWL